MSIGENIKKLRKQCNMTQKQLSSKTGIAVITIQQYESEKYNPKIGALSRLCVALDCKITDLIDEDSQKYYRMFDNTKPQIRIEHSPEAIEIDRIKDNFLNDRESVTPEELKLLKEYYNSESVTDRFGRMVQAAREAFNTIAYVRIQAACEELNEAGQEKVAEHAEMIAKIPEYQKKPDKPSEE